MSYFFSILNKCIDTWVHLVLSFQTMMDDYPLTKQYFAALKTTTQSLVYGWRNEPTEWDCWTCYVTMKSEDEYMWNEGDQVYIGAMSLFPPFDLIIAKTQDGRRGVRVTQPEDLVPQIFKEDEEAAKEEEEAAESEFESRSSETDYEKDLDTKEEQEEEDQSVAEQSVKEEQDETKEEEEDKYVWVIPSIRTRCPFITIKYKPSSNGSHYLDGLPYNNDTYVEEYLNVGKEYYYVGNELFSAAFIKRYLQYHGTVSFRDKYVLELLDGDAMKVVTVKPNQYIRLLENGAYEVISQ